jgi:hypothetical protein
MDDNYKLQGWGKDELSKFIGIAQNNELATFDNKRPEYSLLQEVDRIYLSVVENLINTESFLPSLLYMRSHSAYRGACRLILSGQVPESYVLSRSCLEYALYALHMFKSKDSESIWAARHNSKTAESKCRNEFSYGKVISTLKGTDEELADVASELYGGFIDHGGHPNEKAITSSLRVPKTERGYELKQLYLHGDTAEFNAGLANVRSVGLCALFIFRIIWKERFAIVGVSDELEALNRNLTRRSMRR